MFSIGKQFSEIITKNKHITKQFFENVKYMSSVSKDGYKIEEQKVNVDGINMNYVRTGVGEHAVLLLPGSLGSIWTDFKPQIENLNKEKLTIVAWDPPGYGKSRPPDRTYPPGYYVRDATWAYQLMKTLGYDKFSLVGWSSGGISSVILAAEHPENVRKMVITGTNTYVAPGEMDVYEKIKNIDTWAEKRRTELIKVFGEEYLRETWIKWVDAMRYIFEECGGDICKSHTTKVKCPTLIVHGEKDPLVFREHADYLKENIKNSRLELFKSGSHNLHLRYADEFNKLVNDFLIE